MDICKHNKVSIWTLHLSAVPNKCTYSTLLFPPLTTGYVGFILHAGLSVYSQLFSPIILQLNPSPLYLSSLWDKIEALLLLTLCVLWNASWAVRTSSSHCLCCSGNEPESCPWERRLSVWQNIICSLDTSFICLSLLVFFSGTLKHIFFCLIFKSANHQEKKPEKTSLLTSHTVKADGVRVLK